MNNQTRMHFENPFFDTAPISSPSMLYGRDGILRNILTGIVHGEKPINQELIGLSNSGRTSILKSLVALKEWEDNSIFSRLGFSLDDVKNIILVYVDCNSVTNESDFWRLLYIELKRSLKHQLPSIIPEQTDRGIASFIDFRTTLTNIYSIESNSPFRIVFLLDEFENTATRLDISISNQLRSLFDYFDYLALVTVSRKPLSEYYQNRRQSLSEDQIPSSWLYNQFDKKVYVGLLENEDSAEEYITNKSAHPQKIFTSDEIKYALSLSGLHPELIRIVCKHLYSFRLRNTGSEINYPGIEKGLSIDTELFFSTMLDDINTEQQRLLRKMETAPEKAMVHPQMEILSDLGLVFSGNGQRYKYFSPLLLSYLQNHGINNGISLTTPSNQAKTNRNGQNHITLFSNKRIVEIDGDLVKLSPTEWRVFNYLYKHKNIPCSHQELQKVIGSGNRIATKTSLGVTIRRLREKVEKKPNIPSLIETIRGYGYKLVT